LALLATPVGGTRRQFRRTSSIAFDGEQLGFRADKCAALAKLPLAAGAITFAFCLPISFIRSLYTCIAVASNSIL
jgi:hypothetical protein